MKRKTLLALLPSARMQVIEVKGKEKCRGLVHFTNYQIPIFYLKNEYKNDYISTAIESLHVCHDFGAS